MIVFLKTRHTGVPRSSVKVPGSAPGEVVIRFDFIPLLHVSRANFYPTAENFFFVRMFTS